MAVYRRLNLLFAASKKTRKRYFWQCIFFRPLEKWL